MSSPSKDAVVDEYAYDDATSTPDRSEFRRSTDAFSAATSKVRRTPLVVVVSHGWQTPSASAPSPGTPLFPSTRAVSSRPWVSKTISFELYTRRVWLAGRGRCSSARTHEWIRSEHLTRCSVLGQPLIVRRLRPGGTCAAAPRASRRASACGPPGTWRGAPPSS